MGVDFFGRGNRLVSACRRETLTLARARTVGRPPQRSKKYYSSSVMRGLTPPRRPTTLTG